MIERETRDGCVVLRLCHGKASALDVELLQRLGEELDQAELAGASVVLTGTGRIFSAGVDLFRVLDGGNPYLDRFLPALDAGLRRLYDYPRPVIAAVNGHALAGGWILACACDYRVVVDGPARLGVPELQVGVAFPVFPLEIVRAVTPPQLLSAMVLGTRTFTGDEALVRGLADEVLPAELLLERGCEVATAMGRIDPRSFELAKRQIHAPVHARARDLAEQDPEAESVWRSDAARLRIQRYLESLSKG